MINNKNTKRLLASVMAITLGMTFAPLAPAYAGVPACSGSTLELGLGIDGSGSISPADFALQKNAYANVLGTIPTDGTVAVGVWQFDHTIVNVFPTTVISSVADRNNLVTAVNGMTQLGGNTALAGVISTIATELSTNGIVMDREVIDISTDGFDTVGGNPVQAALDAVNLQGINQVNGLGIGVLPNFNAGIGSFSVQVDSFADFQDALDNKLQKEFCPVGGSILPIDTAALLLAGAFTNAIWIAPVLAGAAGTAAFYIKTRKN